MYTQKVIIVDDQNIFANGLKQLLENSNNIEVVKIVTNGSDVLETLNNYHCDTLLLDLKMPKKNGFEVLEEIRDKFPDLYIIILSTFNQKYFVEKAKKLGANAYLSKDAAIDEMIDAVMCLHNSDFYVSEEIDFKLKKQAKFKKDEFLNVALLTSREKEILKLIVSGKIFKEIADELKISPLTVRTHRRNLMVKLNVNNTTELIKYAYENKVV